MVIPGFLRCVDQPLPPDVVNPINVVCNGNVDSQWSSNAEMHVPELITVWQQLLLVHPLVLYEKPAQPSSASHASLHPCKVRPLILPCRSLPAVEGILNPSLIEYETFIHGPVHLPAAEWSTPKLK